MKVKLTNGFKCEINENLANDMELIDLLAEAKEDATCYSKVVLKVFGQEQRDKLYDVLRKEDGTVPTANLDGNTYSITDAVNEAVLAIGPAGKN